MVGVAGKKDRQVQLIRKDGYDIVVFGGWKNWEKYFDIYLGMKIEDKDGNVIRLRPEFQWQWGQNYPELVVEDIVSTWWSLQYEWDDESVRNLAYAELLYRGVNKWLFVRYLIVRYKKMVAKWSGRAWDSYARWKRLYDIAYPRRFEMSVSEWGRLNYVKGYWKGYYDAISRVRADLKVLCSSPRYVVWNGSKPGFAVDRKIHQGWLNLVKRLYDVRFEK